MAYSLATFYQSQIWQKFRDTFIADKLQAEGELIDEETGKPILKKSLAILHHKIHLTEDNVNDFNISLNPENIELVSLETHNKIHNKFNCSNARKIYISKNADSKIQCDLRVDFDSINKVLGGSPLTWQNAWKLYYSLIDDIYYNYGKWKTALVVCRKDIEYKKLKEKLQAEEI